jgi:hypothetical protein
LQRAQGLLDLPGFVEGGDDDGDAGRGHAGESA